MRKSVYGPHPPHASRSYLCDLWDAAPPAHKSSCFSEAIDEHTWLCVFGAEHLFHRSYDRVQDPVSSEFICTTTTHLFDIDGENGTMCSS